MQHSKGKSKGVLVDKQFKVLRELGEGYFTQ